jgi:hypothetical protein
MRAKRIPDGKIQAELSKACLMPSESPPIDVSFEPVTSTQLSLIGEPESILSVNGALLQNAILVAGHYKALAPRWRCIDIDARLIVRALRMGYSASQLVDSIDGYWSSEWHQGANETGKKYLYLGLILRDKSHIDSGIRMLGKTRFVEDKNKTVADRWADK